MPSADQVPVKSSHSTMQWHLWVVLIAGSTGSALRAVRLPTFTSRRMIPSTTLLLGRLGLDKPHVCPGDCFANGLGVSGIVLLALDVGPHVGRRHQAHLVPERLELARPMMRCGASLDAD